MISKIEISGLCAKRSAGLRPPGRRGSTVTEFALTAPLYFAALMGVLEISWQFAISASLDRATVHASRFGITGQAGLGSIAPGCRSQAIPQVIRAASGNTLRADRLTVTFGGAPGGATQSGPGLGGQITTYNVSYTQPFATLGWVGSFGLPQQIVHRSTIVVKNESFDNAVC